MRLQRKRRRNALVEQFRRDRLGPGQAAKRLGTHGRVSPKADMRLALSCRLLFPSHLLQLGLCKLREQLIFA